MTQSNCWIIDNVLLFLASDLPSFWIVWAQISDWKKCCPCWKCV